MAGPQSGSSSSREFVLGVDLDGVVGDYEGSFRRFIGQQRGVDPGSLPDVHTWSFTENGWFNNDEEYLSAHRDAVNQGLFANMDMISGASDALWALSDAGIRIRIITHRLIINFNFAKTVSDTVTFLDRHRIPYRDLCFVRDKADVGCDLLVDDAPHNIEALRSKHGSDVAITFDQSYNRGVEGLRAISWAEVVAEVERRTGKIIPIVSRG
jgi:5'(3')-deoxyribonucleotidase